MANKHSVYDTAEFLVKRVNELSAQLEAERKLRVEFEVWLQDGIAYSGRLNPSGVALKGALTEFRHLKNQYIDSDESE